MIAQLPLNAQSLHQLGGRYAAHAATLDEVVRILRSRWENAFRAGASGEALQSAQHRDIGLLQPAVETSHALRALAAVFSATARAQQILERYREYVLAYANVAQEYSPAFLIAAQYVQAAGAALDAVCAHEVAGLCTTQTPPVSHLLDTLPDMSAEEIDVLQRTYAPHRLQAFLDAHQEVKLLEVGSHRAVLAVGDVDSASSVTTIVAGVGSQSIDAWPRYVDTGNAVTRATGGAAVVWLGYDAPATIAGAIARDPAEQGGTQLRRFQRELRRRDAARTSGARTSGGTPRKPQRLVVVGHSYGSVVVGHAARGEPLAADALVFAGSPGIGVSHADDVHTDNPHPAVVAVTGRGDPISLTVSQVSGVHGPDPFSPGFGAQRWISDGDHSAYWTDPGFLTGIASLANPAQRPP